MNLPGRHSLLWRLAGALALFCLLLVSLHVDVGRVLVDATSYLPESTRQTLKGYAREAETAWREEGAAAFSVSSGNPYLDPIRATTYDLSLERSNAPESLLSFAYFYKDIDTYIQILRQDLPYASLTTLNPSAFAPGFCTGTCSASTTPASSSATKADPNAPPLMKVR